MSPDSSGTISRLLACHDRSGLNLGSSGLGGSAARENRVFGGSERTLYLPLGLSACAGVPSAPAVRMRVVRSAVLGCAIARGGSGHADMALGLLLTAWRCGRSERDDLLVAAQ
jgi:hypothetical protein